MRWAALFDDLQAHSEAIEAGARSAEISDQARTEAASLRLADRLRASPGRTRLQLRGGLHLSGSLRHVGSDWLLLSEEAGGEAVVLWPAMCTAVGVGRHTVSSTDGPVAARLGVRSALRGIARDRSGVRIALIDGSTVAGTIDRVGADFLEVAVHAVGELRRRADVREIQVIALGAVAAVRRDAT
jgi:hypothetical protein